MEQTLRSVAVTRTSLASALTFAATPAALTIAAILASFCTVYGISKFFHADANAAVLAAVLALTQSRQRGVDHHSPVQKLLAFPMVALGVSLVGALLHFAFVIGAIVFIAGMAFSIWSRQLEGRVRRVGNLVALPLIAIFVAPAPPGAPGGRMISLLLVLIAGIAAYGWLFIVGELAARSGLIKKPPRSDAIDIPTPVRKKSAIDPNTRMAVQMAVALTAAFLIGRLVFTQHWSWVVLTAFIVCSGSVSRGDAVYKGILRLGGAFAGTMAAAVLQHFFAPQGTQAAALIFTALFVGLWLRDLNYAWWAACMTLVIALLQSTGGASSTSILHPRLVEILIGALCAVAATWFVLPLRTDALIRRRLSDALLALDEFVCAAQASDEERARKLRSFHACIERFDRVAPPVEWHRRVMLRKSNDNHPAAWISIMRRCAPHASAFTGSHQELVRAVRQTRKTLAQPELSTTDALRRVHELLESR